VPYQVLDVTAQLQTGSNRIGVLLGDGYYCGALGAGPRQRFGDRPWLLAQLVMRFPGGESRLIVTDGSWQWRPSWVLQADPFLGESVDGRQRLPDWSVSGSSGDWYSVACNEALSPRLCANLAFPVRVGQAREPVGPPLRRVDAAGRVRLIYDFGLNMIGRLRLTLRASRGADIRIRYAESVEPNGELQGLPGMALSEDHYAAAGPEQEDRFESVFGLHGFRYVEVSGPLARDAVSEILALEVVTSAPPAGRFTCDHALLNGLHDNVQRTLRHTLLQQPLAGFSARQRVAEAEDGRAQIGIAACLLDAAAAYRSWLRDLVDAQEDDGRVPSVVPPFVGLSASAAAAAPPVAGGAAALLVCAWALYRHYGDWRSLEFAYPAVQRCLAGLRAARPELVLDVGDGEGGPEVAMVDAAWYCYALTLAARIAGVLGRLADLEAFEALRLRVRAAFRRRFVTPDGLLVGDSQLAYLLGLYLGLLEGAERSRALQRLEEQLRQAGFHGAVDYRDGALLLEVLTLTGRVETAYQVLLQTSAPSWLHPVREGATSSVDEVRGLQSRAAAGSVVEWLYASVAGLELNPDLTPDQNAYHSVRIRPRPPISMALAGGLPLTRVAAALDTVNGRYESAWDLDDTMFCLRVSVPCNCSARVILPDGTIHDVVAGRHEFSMPLERLHQAADGIPVLRNLSEAY
jgi:alpha-L-rhamnosidase